MLHDAKQCRVRLVYWNIQIKCTMNIKISRFYWTLHKQRYWFTLKKRKTKCLGPGPRAPMVATPMYIYTCLLLLISMLWHRQAIFKSKGDKLCSSAESRIWTRDPRHQFASKLNARWQTDWAIENQAKNFNSTARPYDQRAFSPLGPTVSWKVMGFLFCNVKKVVVKLNV